MTMKLLDPPDAWGYTIFCDDIRVEIGNKLTYVGTYSGQLLIHGSFPSTIPKLCLGIVYYQRLSKGVLPVRINVFMPNDPDEKPSFQAEMPPEAAQHAVEDAQELASREGPQAAAFVTAYMQVAFTPATITQPGLVRVRAIRGDELIRLGTLDVRPAADVASPPIGPLP